MKLACYYAGKFSQARLCIINSDGRLLDVEAAVGHLVRHPLSGADGDVLGSLTNAPQSNDWLTSSGQASLQSLSKWMPRLPDELFISADSVRLAPPVPNPGKIIATGLNYNDHVKEAQKVLGEKGGSAPDLPPFPTGFIKLQSALTGHDSAILIPEQDEWMDYEIELAVVIGRRADRVKKEDALAYVAGYTIHNDVSARRIQLAEMQQKVAILLGKNYATFAPMGPCMVSADEIGDPQRLDIELKVNGEVRQHANTADMIFSVAEQVAYWSKIGLNPGDIISTGTPSGVAVARPNPGAFYLKPGDVVEASIQGIGVLRNTVS